MATLAERILELLRDAPPLDEDKIASRVGVIRQQVNQTCRRLEQQRVLVREQGWRER